MNVTTDYVANIKKSNLTIHDPIEIGDPDLWIPDETLEVLLSNELLNKNVTEYAIKSRSKVIKQWVCEALGYPVEKTFPRNQPRFTGQNFDIYNQKSKNLQIWNENIEPQRRYVIIGIDNNDIIFKVRVLNGVDLANLDKTGTLTSKFQARFTPSVTKCELISESDTYNLKAHLSNTDFVPASQSSPIELPTSKQLIPIKEIYNRLTSLVGKTFQDPGITQERNRGAGLHKLVCSALGYNSYADDGTFPDLKNQILEVKLQTSPTIDLGVVCPNSEKGIGFAIGNTAINHMDTRYAVFYAKTDNTTVTITNLVVTTGKDFFQRFTRFEGNIQNKKLQIPLPRDFFE